MIRRNLTTRQRPDTLPSERMRPARKSPARAIYLVLVLALAGYLSAMLLGPYLALQSGGIVTTERFTVASPYTSRVVKVHVLPGDKVSAGAPLLTVDAPEALDITAKLSGQRNTLLARELQVTARLSTIRQIRPIATRRRERAQATSADISRVAVRGLIPLTTHTEAGRELYEAEREEATLDAEGKSLRDEQVGLRGALQEVDAALAQVRRTYGDGIIRSPVDGVVSPRVATQGSVARAGESMLDVLHGKPFILAYLPIGRLYGVKPGMPVVVTDGSQTKYGRIERIEAVADALPSEFQNAFRPTDRQQIMRITYDGDQALFPVMSKVDVSTPYGVSHLQAKFKEALASARLLPSSTDWMTAIRFLDGAWSKFAVQLTNGRPGASPVQAQQTLPLSASSQ